MLFWHWHQRRSHLRQKFQPVILVTGCSSGVGLALARMLREQGKYRVVVTARAKSYPGLAKEFHDDERFWVRKLDVTSQLERVALIREIEEKWQGVDILINNAGISYRAVLEHMTNEAEHHQMETNYFGPVELMRLVLPKMRSQGRGKIINVSSVSGMLAMPTMASYSASKYALEGVSEALWYELKPLGINVCLIQPGFIRSLSFKNVYHTAASKPEVKPDATEGTYADYYASMTPFIENLMGRSFTTPKSVARKILKVIRTERPPLWIPATFDALCFYYLRRLIPRRILLPLLFAALPNSRRWASHYTHRRGHPLMPGGQSQSEE